MQRETKESKDGKEISGGDALRNENSHEYLAEIVKAMRAVVTHKPADVDFQLLKELGPIFPLYDYFVTTDYRFDATYEYGDFFSRFLEELENNLDKIQAKIKEQYNHKQPAKAKFLQDILDATIETIYANPNRALERSGKMIEKIVETNPSHEVEKAVTIMMNQGETINQTTPQYQGSNFGRMFTSVSSSYKPQFTTSMTSIRNYRYKDQHDPVEYRFGTQGQYDINDGARVSPLFKEFLRIQQIKRNKNPPAPEEKSTRITHIYFNNLAYDRNDREGLNEANLSKELHKLEMGYPCDLFLMSYKTPFQQSGKTASGKTQIFLYKKNNQFYYQLGADTTAYTIKDENALRILRNLKDQDFNDSLCNDKDIYNPTLAGIDKAGHIQLSADHNNIAVITLPADKGLMKLSLLHKNNPAEQTKTAYNEMLAVAQGTSTEKIKDFVISDSIKMLLYGTTVNGRYDLAQEEKMLKHLLNESFRKFGRDPEQGTISPSERQIIYFHFIKFELTDFIIDKLRPESFNISCKDAIDRGGVASAYYNLMKSLETNKPLNKDEFYRALHAASTLVKGRGMNSHVERMWYAVDLYLKGPERATLNQLTWLVEWRNTNAPADINAHTNLNAPAEIDIKQVLLQQLKNYPEKRRLKGETNSSFDMTTKISAAETLYQLMTSPDKKNITFTQKQADALDDGGLKKIVSAMIKAGMLNQADIDCRIQQVVIHTHGMGR